MVYVYQVSLDIEATALNQLEVEQSLAQLVRYLHARLEDQLGFVNVRAMFSLDRPQDIWLVLQSVWETWDDVLDHRNSSLLGKELVAAFTPHADRDRLSSTLFEQVG
jgi:hypothetical protein